MDGDVFDPSRLPDGALMPAATIAMWLGIEIQTLAKWRCTGHGPSFQKVGRRSVRYRAGDVRDWLASQGRGTHAGNLVA